MMWWNRIHAALLSVFCLQHFIRLMSAQSYEFVMNLNEYQSGDRVPDPVFLRACLRDSSEGCTAMCLESESRDASLDDVSTVSPLIFSTDVGEYMLCTEFRESDNSNLIVTNSISISITGRTEFPVNERYVSPDRRRDRITLRYTYQVRCAATFISLSCSELCFPVDSVNFECGGNQEIICLPGYTINTSPNGEGGPCMACIPSIPGCPGYVTTAGTTTTATTAEAATTVTTGLTTGTTQQTIGNDLETDPGNNIGNNTEVGNERGLSGGQVAGIVLPILIVTALVVGAAVVGALIWKYQPWDNILKKKDTEDAIENPVYDEMEMGMDSSAVQSGHELSASTFSSPLYSSQSVDEGASSAGATERNKYAENGTLMDLIRMRSARGKNGHNQTSPNVMETAPPAAQNGAAATPRGEATGKVDPYASYKDNVTFGATSEGDDENVYEPVEAPESNFDNPDYEAL